MHVLAFFRQITSLLGTNEYVNRLVRRFGQIFESTYSVLRASATDQLSAHETAFLLTLVLSDGPHGHLPSKV